MAYDFATQQRAEELYVLNGLTYEEIAQDVEASVRTVNTWAQEGKWRQKRKEFRSAASDIRRYATLARLNLIKKAMRTEDPQAVYAFAALERATREGVLPNAPAVESTEQEPREIRTPEDAVKALEDAVQAKLNAMLCNPAELNLSGIKDVKKALEMVAELKSRYAPASAEAEEQGIDAQTIADIRKQLGL